eukprot:TRINITY_DN70410_c0_g1_i1.p1 TRINITY_DN70410_c0_g1~~TRINITY_DN70410_c0_g1_i1.p1  ORF type:complete len:348 (-),score=21.95 TRINITY_DN70410_c0_g1_i1:35-1078(-)
MPAADLFVQLVYELLTQVNDQTVSCCREREKFHDVKALVEQYNQMQSQDIISIDVGGIVYRTLRDTLTGESATGSMLEARFGGLWDDELQEDGGEITHLIDRDGILFASILGFLRDGPQYPLTGPTTSRNFQQHVHDLMTEARFYGLDSLLSALQPYHELKFNCVTTGTIAEEGGRLIVGPPCDPCRGICTTVAATAGHLHYSIKLHSKCIKSRFGWLHHKHCNTDADGAFELCGIHSPMIAKHVFFAVVIDLDPICIYRFAGGRPTKTVVHHPPQSGLAAGSVITAHIDVVNNWIWFDINGEDNAVVTSLPMVPGEEHQTMYPYFSSVSHGEQFEVIQTECWHCQY